MKVESTCEERDIQYRLIYSIQHICINIFGWVLWRDMVQNDKENLEDLHFQWFLRISLAAQILYIYQTCNSKIVRLLELCFRF